MSYDIFISHASEDKKSLVLPLAELLTREHGLKVWVDDLVLKAGDSLRRNIDRGLSESRYGVVILSPHFYEKEWPQKELDALTTKESNGKKVVIPVLHQILQSEVLKRTPLLADKVTVSTEDGIEHVARKIADAVTGDLALTKAPDRPTVIGISGASCSGKSWLAKKLKLARPASVTLFDLDSYYKDASLVATLEHRYDNPQSIFFDDAIADLISLKRGHEVKIPNYNFETRQVDGEKPCKPSPLIVVEGIFVFANARLLKEVDIKIWVDAGEDLRYERRMTRDTSERGRSLDEFKTSYAQDVKPGHQKYIQPLRNEADLIFENNGRDQEQRPMIIEMLLSYVEKLS